MIAQGIMDKKAGGNMYLTNCCITDDRTRDLLSVGNVDSLSIAQSCNVPRIRREFNFVQSFIHTQRACVSSKFQRDYLQDFRINQSIHILKFVHKTTEKEFPTWYTRRKLSYKSIHHHTQKLCLLKYVVVMKPGQMSLMEK
jgi:hypothetical protein